MDNRKEIQSVIADLVKINLEAEKNAKRDLAKIKECREVNQLIRSLGKPSPWVRDRTVQAIREISSKKSVDTLLNAPESVARIYAEEIKEAISLILKLREHKTKVKIAAIESLGKTTSSEAGHALARILLSKGELSMIQRAAARALGEIKGYTKAEDTLIQALGKRVSKTVQLASIESLGKIGGKSAVDALIKLRKKQDPELNEAIGQSFAKLKNPKGISRLTALLAEPDKSMRLIAMKMLAKTCGSKPVKTLIEILVGSKDKPKSQDVEMRGQAASILGQSWSLRATGALVRAMKEDEDAEVRRIATKALGRIGRKKRPFISFRARRFHRR